MSRKFGIVQGRLTQSPPGQLQWFPQGKWEAEFPLARELGLSFVELIAERNRNPENPLWTDEGVRKIRALNEKHGLESFAFCDDFVIDHPLHQGREGIEHSLALVKRGALLGMKLFVVPLFEKGELNVGNQREFLAPLREIADACATHGIRMCLETVLDGRELAAFLDELARPNACCVFDTGNRAAFGQDIYGDILALGPRIAHVHLKDKNAEGQNVYLGTGKVNFHRIFERLREVGYTGHYTFESVRGLDPARTVRVNLEHMRFLMDEAGLA